ncbi:hypothetical protein ACFVYT_07800 [Streptomyces sp. NPDC058290]|uniref:hypothetical protein n=1 Tax=Streptomyces sp. NPDC058290 TaxID=3346426 RepID=UPI0036EAB6B9
MAAFAYEMTWRTGKAWDGPDVVTKVRNYLVHPEEDQKEHYRLPGLVIEVWLVTRHCLSLLARLVCLRVEFPLFARDLLLDHRLCDYVLMLDTDRSADLGPFVSEQVKEAARGYAGFTSQVDRQLSVDSSEEDAAAVRKHHGRQLVAYLHRTRSLSGPGRDLIFLQTSGSVFGLPAALAETLEQHAQNADLGPMQSAVADLSPAERPAVLALLIQQAREAIGLEAWNVAQAALALCGDENIPIDAIADSAIEALAPSLVGTPHALPDEVIPGCWRLARSSDRVAARGIRSLVLRHSGLDENTALAASTLRHMSDALAADAERVQELVCAHLLSDDCDPLVSLLTGLPSAEAGQLMDAVGPALTKDLQAAFEAHDAWKATQAAPAAGASASEVGEEEPPLPGIALEALDAISRFPPEAPQTCPP